MAGVIETIYNGKLEGDFNLNGHDFANVSGVTAFVRTAGSYPNPSWITALAWAKITGAPATFSPTAHASSHANGGSDPVTLTVSQITGLATVAVSGAFADLVSHPTTIGGYGITDFNSSGDARWSLLAHTHTFANLTSKPTTIAGFAITDAYTKTETDSAISSAVVGLLDDRGNYNASGNVFPSSGGSGSAGAILKGDLWTISVAGTLNGIAVTAGDVLRALTDTPGQTGANWVVTENNLGYVPVNAAGTLALAGFASITGTVPAINVAILNQNTSGSAASLSINGQTGLLTVVGLTTTNRVKTVRDAADTILELGGSYTPTGTWTNLTLVNPALGTPASGVATNLTGTASGLTAGTVTTNANLTGHITSSGNAAILGSFTFAQLNTAVSDADVARTDAANTFTGHQTIEGVTSTGATGTGKFVFDTNPILSSNLSVGGTVLVSNSSVYSLLQIGATSTIQGDNSGTSNGLNISQNAAQNSSDIWKYLQTAAAANYTPLNGAHYFRTAPSGSAGGTITWTIGAKIDGNTTAGETQFSLYDITAATLKRVSIGAADSGGSGYKLLRIPN